LELLQVYADVPSSGG